MNILRIAMWNANGLLNHKQEEITFLNLKNIDVLFISESHFTELRTFNFPQYITYSTPHPDGTAHGCSTIIIRKSIPHNELPKFQTDKIQATTVEIKDSTWQFTVTAIYSPPRHSISTDEYNNFFQPLGTR
jgi:exonuclease III